jgi:serine/threonine-protein kinase 24/25/MST4
LTELIERHERWKAEGGDRQDEEDHHSASDLYVAFSPSSCSLFSSSRRPASGDPEDLWDFGTVRHAATVGRSQTQIHVSGPPLTWENNGTRRSDGSSGSSGGSSYISTNSSITVKGDLPPLPPSPASSRRVDQQATVRHMPDNAGSRNSHHTVQREPSDEYDDDYDDQYSDTYSRAGSTTQLSEKLSHVQLEDDLPDTTMLDSVILPAIASVCILSP